MNTHYPSCGLKHLRNVLARRRMTAKLHRLVAGGHAWAAAWAAATNLRHLGGRRRNGSCATEGSSANMQTAGTHATAATADAATSCGSRTAGRMHRR